MYVEEIPGNSNFNYKAKTIPSMLTSSSISLATPKKSVLIVEDDEDSQLVLKWMFEKQGFSVSVARSGDSADQKFRDNNYDLIFCDRHLHKKVSSDPEKFTMPTGYEMNGTTTIEDGLIIAKHLVDVAKTHNESNPDNKKNLEKVIICTGSTESQPIKQYKGYDIEYLLKPLEKYQLKEVLNKN